MNNVDLAVQFFLQIAVILTACRIVGVVARWVGQPQVVAEMIAGVLLGPSLLGLYFPEHHRMLFPWDPTQASRDTQCYLFPASQLGLALYMFIVGMEFRVDIVRKTLGASVAVSAAGMIAPFVLGAGLAVLFKTQTELFPQATSLTQAMLFLGASMCITAFPMLARIIHFKGLAGTTMGTVAIGAGAIDDAAAWCMLAVVLASFDGAPADALWVMAGGAAFVVTVLLVLPPVLRSCQRWLAPAGKLSDAGLVVGLSLMAAGAAFTDALGLHAVFGAFVVGASMPRGAVAKGLISKIQPLTVALLLPLFFAYSGLNTKIGLLNSWTLWGVCAMVLGVAVLGKGVACWGAARAVGLPNREALGIGTLMNARGLMELIIINIGLQRGVISAELFATLVIMAVVTTLIASPLFDLFVGPVSSADTPPTGAEGAHAELAPAGFESYE